MKGTASSCRRLAAPLHFESSQWTVKPRPLSLIGQRKWWECRQDLPEWEVAAEFVMAAAGLIRKGATSCSRRCFLGGLSSLWRRGCAGVSVDDTVNGLNAEQRQVYPAASFSVREQASSALLASCSLRWPLSLLCVRVGILFHERDRTYSGSQNSALEHKGIRIPKEADGGSCMRRRWRTHLPCWGH